MPSNFFAVDVLGKAAEILSKVNGDEVLAEECRALALEVSSALKRHAVVETKDFGEIYAFEVDGYGGALLMDDAAEAKAAMAEFGPKLTHEQYEQLVAEFK